jgi:lipoprotein-anchoring transpeptidase ErfK/SrfK
MRNTRIRFFSPFLTPVLALVQLHAALRAPDESILINLADRTLSILNRDGDHLAVYPIAVGKLETPTPIGAFRVRSLDPHPVPRTGMFGTRWIEFFRGKTPEGNWFLYGIHGTNEPQKIGRAVSQGCIRLSNRDIEEVFQRAYLGESVVIIDGAGDTC